MSLLPTKPSIPAQKLEEYNIVIFGPPGIGKTSLGAQFPKSLFALFEEGTTGLLTNEVNLVKESRIQQRLPWDIFLETKEEFLNEDHNFQTFIIDSADEAYNDCMDYICREREIDHPSEEGYGSAWNALTKEFQKAYRDLSMSKYGLVTISHAKYKEIEDIHGNKHDKLVPSTGGSTGSWLIDQADIIILYDRNDENQRILRLEGNKNYEAKQRLDFPEPVISAGDSAEEAFNNFKNAFDAAIDNINKKLGVTQEMIDEYYEEKQKEEKIMSVREKVKETAKKKGLNPIKNSEIMKEQVGVESIHKLDYDSAQKYLEFLNNEYEG